MKNVGIEVLVLSNFSIPSTTSSPTYVGSSPINKSSLMVAEHGSALAVARHLDVTKSIINCHLVKLAAELSVQCFDRRKASLGSPNNAANIAYVVVDASPHELLHAKERHDLLGQEKDKQR